MNPLIESWLKEVLQKWISSRTANAGAAGAVAVVLMPQIMAALNSGTHTLHVQVLVGALASAYIISRGLADHGKEAILFDVRKNLMVALTNGSIDPAKTVALHDFVATGNVAGMVKVLEDEAVKMLKAQQEEAQDQAKPLESPSKIIT